MILIGRGLTGLRAVRGLPGVPGALVAVVLPAALSNVIYYTIHIVLSYNIYYNITCRTGVAVVLPAAQGPHRETPPPDIMHNKFKSLYISKLLCVFIKCLHLLA